MMGIENTAARELGESLRPFGFAGPAFSCAVQTLPAQLVTGGELSPGTRVVLVVATARPQRFVSAARGAGFSVADFLTFPDHHGYPDRSLRLIEETWAAANADAVLTTSKDRVKLLGRLDLPLAELPIRAQPDDSFWTWLSRRLDQQMAASRP